MATKSDRSDHSDCSDHTESRLKLNHLTLMLYPLTVNASEAERKALMSELELMKKLKPHPHVIKLLGCITGEVKYDTCPSSI